VRVAFGFSGYERFGPEWMLGHTSAKVTLDMYADLFDADLDAVAATLHATYSRENVATGCP
jgi:hypothetical protein